MKLDDFETKFGRELFKKHFEIYLPKKKTNEPVLGTISKKRIRGPQPTKKRKIEGKIYVEEKNKPKLVEQELKDGCEVEDLHKERNIVELFNQQSIEYEPKVEIDPFHPLEQNNVYDTLLKYFHSNILSGKKVKPVLEEDKNCLLATVAACSGLSTIIEGESRSGKSLIMDKLTNVLDSTYSIKICSNKAMFDSSEAINKKHFLYVEEYQQAIEGNTGVKETFKLVTEGKDATSEARGKIKTIDGHITILSTAAKENKKTQNRDVEVSGRFLLLETESSFEKVERIIEYMDGLGDGTRPDISFNLKEFNYLKNKVKSIYLDQEENFENPFRREISKYLPQTKKSIHYRNIFFDLIDGFSLFEKNDRIRKDNDKLITNLSDVYLAYATFHSSYCDALQKLATQSYESMEKDLNALDKQEKKSQLEEEIRMIDESKSKKVDWEEMWNIGYKHMAERNPFLLEQWMSNQTKETNGIKEVRIYNPILRSDFIVCGAKEHGGLEID